MSEKMWSVKNFPNKPVALVMNCGINGLGVIRSLGAKGVPVLALDPAPLAIGLYSKYARKIICPDPLCSEEAFVEFLIDIGKRLPVRGMLFPTSDPYVVAIAKARDKLENYYWIPFSPWEVIREIVDKETQYKKAMEAGIPVPKTFFPKSVSDVREIGKVLQYPVILKPAYSHPFVAKYWIKAVKVNSLEELIEKYEMYTCAGHKMLIQEIVGGTAARLYEFFSYTNVEGEPLGIFVQRKLDQYPSDFGSGTVFESVDEPRIVELGLRLLKAFHYYGISFSEFKRDPADGGFKLMELNPRTTHCNSLSTACGVNFPYVVYENMLGKAVENTNAFSCGVRWIHLEERLFKQRKISLRDGKRSLSKKNRYVSAVFAFDDPLPGLVYIFRALYNRGRNFLKALGSLVKFWFSEN